MTDTQPQPAAPEMPDPGYIMPPRTLQPGMVKVRLETNSGLVEKGYNPFVAYIQVPPFRTAPAVILWGERVFTRAEQQPKEYEGKEPYEVYRECFYYCATPPFNDLDE